MKKITIIIIGVAMVIGIVLLIDRNQSLGGGDGFSAFSCTTTHTTPTVGSEVANILLAAHSRRAYAEIHIGDNATNTVALSFGGTATLAGGYPINAANNGGASSTPSVVFGLNTDFPFTGDVTGIADTSSTTVQVVQCLYNR